MNLPGWRVTNVAIDGLGREMVYAGRLAKYGRPTIFGNPFGLMDLPRGEAVSRHAADLERRITSEPEFRMAVLSLAGRVVACHCKPSACHGETIASVADRLFREMGVGRALCVAPTGEAGLVIAAGDDLPSALEYYSERLSITVYEIALDGDDVIATPIWQGRAVKLVQDPETLQRISQRLGHASARPHP